MNNVLAEHAQDFWQFPTANNKCMDERIAVVGLGYVGLPLGLAFADTFAHVVGFDSDDQRIRGLQDGFDRTKEVGVARLRVNDIQLSAQENCLAGATIFIVTVPTPVDNTNRPDFKPLRKACRTVARYLTAGSVVVFESTVYPGATEEICVPELTRFSGLVAGRGFTVGYSPERISPGDAQRGLGGVVKIVSAMDERTLDRVAKIYEKVVPAGVYRAQSIQIAEAAKVFENTQRDVNIGLMNEFAIICDRLGLRTSEVLQASGTKWNALPFVPGLVGGHCIGIDPYYLVHKAEEKGYSPEIVRASRKVNESISRIIAQKGIRHLAQQGRPIAEARVCILGITFKENVPDLRNSKVFDLISEFNSFGIEPLVHDPVADPNNPNLHNIKLVGFEDLHASDIVIYAVPHDIFDDKGQAKVISLAKKGGLVVDVRSRLDSEKVDDGVSYWSL